jgi:hypothetical protein
MSENLYSANTQGDFNDSTIDGSGYGAFSAAEKNQTYFAYFSSVGGTGPELIDQTAYFVKYLIDAQGNVVTPQPNSIDVLNLIQNFEPGKTVNVTSLEGTTLFNSLLGTKTVTDIGRIDTILTTETGSGRMDYLRTMSFSQGGTSLQTPYSPDYTFSAKKVTTSVVTDTTWTDLPFALELSDPSSSYDPTTYTYSFSTNTYDYSTKVIFKASVLINGLSSEENFYLQIVKSTDNFLTSQSLELTIPLLPNSSYYTSTNTPPTQYVDSNTEGSFYVANGNGGSSNNAYMGYIASIPQVFESGSKVKVRYKVGTTGTGTASVTIVGSSPNTLNTSFLATTNYSNALEITSSYWLGALNFPTSSNAVQGLIATLPFSSVLNPQSNFTQTISSASLSLGFNSITSLSRILPGDYIRFEYDKTKQSKVYSVQSIPGGYVYLEINPPVPSGSILDHFTVYRINPNAGNQIILNVLKPTGTTGQPLTGFIKPLHMSKELEDNFTTIVQKLAAEGTI